MITKAIERALHVMAQRDWDSIYWAIDLHGCCLKSNYQNGNYAWISDSAKEALRVISSIKENKIILWSSAHNYEQPAIISFFENEGIKIFDFNKNDEVENTSTGCFDQKFYFSVLIDDKAGFDYSIDWDNIIEFYTMLQNR